jgi:hypothetical protein
VTAQLDPYEIYVEDGNIRPLIQKAVSDNQAALDKLAVDEVEWDLGAACSLDPDDVCESCQ